MAFEEQLKLLLSDMADDEIILSLHSQLYARAAVNKPAFDSICRGIKIDRSDEEAGFFIQRLVRKVSPEHSCSLRIAASYLFMRVTYIVKFVLDTGSSTKLNCFLLDEKDDSVQCNVIRAMSNLAQTPQNTALFAASVPRILQIVSETQDVTLLVNCFRAVRYLCQQIPEMRLLLRHDVLLSKICDILQNSSAELKLATTDEADFNERDAERAGSAGIEADDSVTQEQRETRLRAAISALAFVTRPRAHLIVSSSPYIQHLERAVPLVCELTHHENVDTQAAAIGILLNLAECPAARPSLETSGAIQALIDYVAPIGLSSSSFTSKNSATKPQLDSARALFLLCADGSSRSKIRRLGALRLLLHILRAEQYKTVWLRGMEAVLMFNYDLHALKELLTIGLMEVLLDKLNGLLRLVYRQMVLQLSPPVSTSKLIVSSSAADSVSKMPVDDERRNDSATLRSSSVPDSGVGRLPKIVPAVSDVQLALASLGDYASSPTPPPSQPLKRRRLAKAARPARGSGDTMSDARSPTAATSMSPLSSKYDVASPVGVSPLGGQSSRSSTPMQSPTYSQAMSPPRNFDLCGSLIRSMLTSSGSPPYNSPPYRSPTAYKGGSNKRSLHDDADAAEVTDMMPTAVSREGTLCVNIVKFAYHLSHSDEFASYVCIEKFFSTAARVLYLFTSASLQPTPAAETARQLVTTVSRSLRLCIRNRNCFESIVKAKCASWVDAFDKPKSKLLPSFDDSKIYLHELSPTAMNQIVQFRTELLSEIANVAQTDYGFGTISHMLQPSTREHARRIISLCIPHAYRRSNLLKRLLLYDGAFRCLMALVFESDLFAGAHISSADGKNVDADEMQDPGEDDAEDAVTTMRTTPNSAPFSSAAGDLDGFDTNALRALRCLQLIMQHVNSHTPQRTGRQIVSAQNTPQKKSFVNTSLTATTCCLYETFTENKPGLPFSDDDDIITLAINSSSGSGASQTPVLRCPARRSALMRSSSYFEARLADHWDAKQDDDIVIDAVGLEDIDLEAAVILSPKSSPHRGSDVETLTGCSSRYVTAANSSYSSKQLHDYRNRKRDEQTLRAFVHALHGCSPSSCRLMASLWETNTSQFILKFLLVADQYLCESLFSMCMDWLQVNCLSEDSVADVYSLAQNRLTNVKGLADACVRFVLGEVADVERVFLIFCDFVQCSSLEILRGHVERVFQHCLRTL